MTKRHTDTKPGWIVRKFAAIDKQIRELSAARRLEASTIGAGGLTVKNGGQINVQFPGGAEGIVLGPMGDDVGGRIGTAIEVHRGDNAEAVLFGVYHISPGLNPSFPTGYENFQVSADDVQLGADNQVIVAGGTSTIVADNVGGIVMGAAAGVRIQHSTTGASANCFIDPSDSRIWRSTSSRRYKQDIEDAAINLASVLSMRGRTWRDKAEVEANPETERRYVGFIAEELHELGLGQFVVYDSDDEPEAIAYDRLSVALLEVVKSLDARVQKLEEL